MAESFIASLQEMLDREHFQPFRIVTASGDKYDVANPRLVAIGETKIFIFGNGDNFVLLRNSQITALETIPQAA